MNDDLEKLQQITRDLLLDDNPGSLRAAALELHALFSGLGGISENSLDEVDNACTILPTGLALAPNSAALCTLQYARTAKFLRGVFSAVEVAKERFPSQPVEILYAGCGPLAPLAIPLMTRFTPEQIQFTLLDIHRRSLDCAQRIVEAFGFDAYVRDYVEADAAVYVHPEKYPLAIVISETMQRALMKEPQVAVTLNLVPQLRHGGILVPERISVEACLFDPGSEMQLMSDDSGVVRPEVRERVRIALSTLLELDIEAVPRLRGSGFSEVRITLPPVTEPPLRLMLRTGVTVFDSIFLGDYESGITYPYLGKDLDSLKPESMAVFRYRAGSMPGFEVEQAG